MSWSKTLPVSRLPTFPLMFAVVLPCTLQYHRPIPKKKEKEHTTFVAVQEQNVLSQSQSHRYYEPSSLCLLGTSASTNKCTWIHDHSNWCTVFDVEIVTRRQNTSHRRSLSPPIPHNDDNDDDDANDPHPSPLGVLLFLILSLI